MPLLFANLFPTATSMALYKADKKDRNKQVYDVYASDASKKSIPKYQMPKEPTDPKVMGDLIIDELMMDGNARQNLATFCQTWLDEQTHRIMDACIDKNMIDKDEYPQTAEIENRCVHILADLWNSPSPADTMGCSTTGSSEAAMLGGLALKWRWRLRRQKEGKPTDKPNIVTGPVQICWHKFARYFDVEIREIPMEHGRLLMTPEEVLKRVDENTIGVVPTLGVTFTGQYEPVKDVCDALDKLQKDTGLDIPVHVDGASGAFLAPFLDPDLLWDFRLPRVKSVNASGHKFGLSPLGVGWVVWREKTDLPEELIFYVNYLGGNMPTFALNFSRPGGQIIAQYYNLLRHGWEGYRHVQQACADHARYFCEQLAKMGPFDIIYNGDGNGIPAGCWKLKPGDHGFTVFDLADRLRIRGWQLPAYTLPANCQDLAIQRILVRHGFSRDMADLLLADIERALAFFKEHPVTKPATEKESGGYHH